MNIVILAAGMGKRMHSKLPKVLQPLAGKPMLDWVLERVQPLSKSPVVVVIGHQADMVQAHYAEKTGISFALQSEQKGTGHALQQALPYINPSDTHTLVCLGDVPLLLEATLARLQEATSGENSMGLFRQAMVALFATMQVKLFALWNKKTRPQRSAKLKKSILALCCFRQLNLLIG